MKQRQLWRIGCTLTLAVALCTALSPTSARSQQARAPYSKGAIVGMLKGDVAPKRIGDLARQRGIDFEITPEVERELRQAGATGELILTLRQLAPAPKAAQIVIQTSPNAQAYLDDTFKGQASVQGRLVIENPKPGEHTLRISLVGKKEYQKRITLVPGQVARVEAALADLAGSIRVQTSHGAEVFLDGSSRGTAGASGWLVIPDVAAGPHQLRVSARGMRDYQQGAAGARRNTLPGIAVGGLWRGRRRTHASKWDTSRHLHAHPDRNLRQPDAPNHRNLDGEL